MILIILIQQFTYIIIFNIKYDICIIISTNYLNMVIVIWGSDSK